MFVSAIHPPTPCANLPNLFAPAVVQCYLCLGCLSNCRYLSCFLVLWLRTGLADSLRHWAKRSAMDDTCVFCSPFITLPAIDSEACLCNAFVGDLTIN